MRRLTLATVTAVLLLAGCTSGSDSGGDQDEPGAAGPTSSGEATDPAPSAEKTSDAPPAPDCDAVWQAGAVLPDDYTSCTVDGEAAVQDVTGCTDGTSLVVYLDSFYAITGEKIVEPDVAPLQDTEEFGAAYSTCTGE
jgi:hypothetical protein